jgi:biopolymer transport protein ExbB
MFVSANIIVKAVMLGLAFASALTWTIWLSRMMRVTGTVATVGAKVAFVGLFGTHEAS